MSVRPVLLVRALGGDDRDADALRALGLAVVEDPWLVVAASTDDGAVARAEQVLEEVAQRADLLLVTSRAALRALTELVGEERVRAALAAGVLRGLEAAAVGPVSAALVRDLGMPEVIVPDEPTARGLTATLRARGGAPLRAVLPCGAKAMRGLAEGLCEDGWHVEQVVLYDTVRVAVVPPSAERLAAGAFSAIVLRSPTAVRAVAERVPVVPAGTAIVCGGPTTAAEARGRWTDGVVVSDAPTAEAVARAVRAAIAADVPVGGAGRSDDTEGRT